MKKRRMRRIGDVVEPLVFEEVKVVEKPTHYEWTRECPFCKSTVYYTYSEKAKYNKHLRNGTRCQPCYNKFIENQRNNGVKKDYPCTKPCPKCGKDRVFTSYASYYCAQKESTKCYCVYRGDNDILAPYPKKRKCPNCKEETLYKAENEYGYAVTRYKKSGDCKHIPNPPKANIEVENIIHVDWQSVRFVPFVDYPLICERCGKERRYKSKDSMRGELNSKSKHCVACAHEIRLDGGKWKCNFNLEACNVVDELNKDGYSFKHALNGGEVRIGRYQVDAYDVNKNIIIEFLDRTHWRTQEARDYHDMRAEWIINKTDAIYLEYDPETNECNRIN